MAKKGEVGKVRKPKKTSPETPTNTVYVSTVTQYLYEIHKLISKNKDAKFIYRGQKDSKDPVNCGAARRYINSGHIGEITKQDLLEYHIDYLFENAKKIGLNFKDGRELKDMELVADIQHHGCATMLIDFTRDPLIALFFATEQSSRNEDTDGAVYVLRINDTLRFKELRTEDVCKADCIKNILSENDHKFLYFWEPTQLNKRIPAQHSVFVFGEPEISSKDILLKVVIKASNKSSEKKGDTLKSPREERKRKRIQNCKIVIQEVLQNSHDLNNTVLFNDLPGFSYANNQYVKLVTKTPSFLLAKARSYFQNNEIKKAIDYYTQYIDITKTNAIGFLERGFSYARIKKYEDAIKDFDKVIELDPKFADAYVSRGTAKDYLGYYQEAIDDFDKAVVINSKNAYVYNNRGNAKSSLGLHEEAINDFNLAIGIDPKNSVLYNNRGNTKSKLGRSEEAIIDFNKAIRIDPKLAAAYTNRGIDKGKLGHYKEAIDDFNKAIEIDPRLTQAYYNRGFIKEKMGLYEDAINDYDKVIEFNPKDKIIYEKKGFLKHKLGRYEEAIIEYNKVIEADPKDASSYYNRGNEKLKLGNIEEAIKDYDKAIEADPKLVEAFGNRGVAKMQLVRFDEAVKDWLMASILFLEKGAYLDVTKCHGNIYKIDKANSLSYFFNSIAQWNLCKKEKSKADYDKAKELATQQDNKQVLKLLEECFNEDGSLKDNWKEVLKKQSENSFD